MGAYYYALSDSNGVLCVDSVETTAFATVTESDVAFLAGTYPDVIYFHHWAGASSST